MSGNTATSNPVNIPMIPERKRSILLFLVMSCPFLVEALKDDKAREVVS